MNLLLTSIGKRIELIEHLKSRFRIIGADASTENAAKYFTDVFYQIPRCSEENYVDKLLTICKKEEVSLLVPLYEPEFMILDGARERFREAGVTLVLSDKAVLDICDDKRKTAVFFEKYDIPAPKTFSAQEVEDIIGGRTAAYPLIVKPVDGMGSENIFMAGDRRELAFFYGYVNNALVQERASGQNIRSMCSAIFPESQFILCRGSDWKCGPGRSQRAGWIRMRLWKKRQRDCLRRCAEKVV